MVHQDIFLEFNREKGSLNDFFSKKCNLNKYKELASPVKIFLTLSHGQNVSWERFQCKGTLLEQNSNKKSITASLLVKDQPRNIEISNKMIVNVKSAHHRYRSHLRSIAETKKSKEDQLVKKRVSDEIKNVETWQDQLKKTVEKLQGGFVKFVKEAKEKQDLAWIFKVNAMKWKVDEKNEEIKKLEQALGILELKRKSLK